MRLRCVAFSFLLFTLAWSTPARAETSVLYSQPDASAEMVSQQATFQNTWITSASLGNVPLGKGKLILTFTMKDPNANNTYGQPAGIALKTCATCPNLQTYYFTNADRTLLADGAFHTFRVETGTTTLSTADGETPVYITFFGLSQYHTSTHLKSNAAKTIPYLIIEGTALPPPVIPQAPEGVIMVYEQSENTGLMTNPQQNFLDAYINSASLGNLPLGQGKLYLTFTMKDPNASNVYGTPRGVCIKPAGAIGCSSMQTYFFTNADRELLADGAFHTFMVETGTTTSTYADGTQPVAISFFGLSQRQYGTKVKSNAAATLPYLTIYSAAPPLDPCAVPGVCASSVLFLPGIEASRLYRPGDIGGIDRLWEPSTDSDAADLFLTTDGTSVRNDVYTKDVVDEAFAYGAGPNIYKSFIEQMNELKVAGTLADWEAVPYDWRLSFEDILNSGRQFPDGRIYYSGELAATSSPYIIQELRRLANNSKTGKVTIVAHSNGGLLTKALVRKLGDVEAAKLIDKIVFVAVPQAGTPQAVGALLHGYEQGLPKDWFSIFLSPQAARTLAANMPSAYNLLPSANYFTHVDDPVVEFDNSDLLAEFRSRYGQKIHSGELLRNFITDTRRLASSSPSDLLYPSVGNAALLSNAEVLHSTFDAWTPPQSITLHEIAGWGENTLATIEYREGKKASCSSAWDIRTCSVKPAIAYDPIEVIEGDGTVLVPSALWTPASTGVQKYWVDLNGYNEDHIDRKHASILEIPELRTLVQNILTSSTSTVPEFISTTQPFIDIAQEKRLRFLLHSPLSLSATDTLGNVVNSTTSTIPGASWRRYGEVQVLSVPEGTPITLNLDGYADGSFTLDMQEVDGANTVLASSTLSAIPSTADTNATIVFPDGTLQSASPLSLDYDGDGATDLSLESRLGEEVVFDMTPPEASITLDPVSQALQVIGNDNLSTATVVTTETSSVVTDEAGNTLEVIFKKFNQKGKQVKVEIQELLYNGVSAGESPKTVLHYEWSVDKTGALKELEEKATIGALKVEGHYSAKKEATKVGKETKPGLVIFGVKTEKGVITINY